MSGGELGGWKGRVSAGCRRTRARALQAHAQGSVSGQVKELVGQVVQGSNEVAVLGHVRQADLVSDGVLELRGIPEGAGVCGPGERRV